MRNKNQKPELNLEPVAPRKTTALQGVLKSMRTEDLAETLELINEIEKLWKFRESPASQDSSEFEKILH
jgi:hypothetical protein